MPTQVDCVPTGEAGLVPCSTWPKNTGEGKTSPNLFLGRYFSLSPHILNPQNSSASRHHHLPTSNTHTHTPELPCNCNWIIQHSQNAKQWESEDVESQTKAEKNEINMILCSGFEAHVAETLLSAVSQVMTNPVSYAITPSSIRRISPCYRQKGSFSPVNNFCSNVVKYGAAGGEYLIRNSEEPSLEEGLEPLVLGKSLCSLAFD